MQGLTLTVTVAGQPMKHNPDGLRESRVLADILTPENNSFGVIRLAMALAVLVSHSYYFVSGDAAREPLVRWTGHSLGEHAVQVFFFLSGVLVTESLLRGANVLDFVTGRVLRIFPGLVACILLTAFVLGPLVTGVPLSAYIGDQALPNYVMKTVFLITGAATLPGTFETLPATGLVNLSLWTLKYEVICYAALAVLGSFGLFHGRVRSVTTALLAVMVFTIFLRSPVADGPYTPADNLRYFALYFSVGTLAALLKDHVVISARATAAFLVLFVASIGTPWAELSCALFIGSATLVVATWSFGPLRQWTNAHDLSFGVYIYAAPLQQALLQVHPQLGPLALSLAVLAPTMLLAAASWTWIEKPASAARKICADALHLGLSSLLAQAQHGRSLQRPQDRHPSAG